MSSGMIMLDYHAVPIDGYKPIDFLGFHAFKQFDDWLYVGVGGHAPLFEGNYGGFMVFDVSAFAKKQLIGNLSANVGFALGGGGGGSSVQQAKVFSGAGGFMKGSVGLGYDFGSFSAGVDMTRIRLTGSIIDRTQLGLYVQTPFSYRTGSYGDSGLRLPLINGADDRSGRTGDDVVDVGVDNIVQSKPQGTFKQTVNLADLQYSHFISNRSFVFVDGGIGYRGLKLYNQIFGGLGVSYPILKNVSARAQIGVGSGGYSPENIDTGSGLLIYPKLSVEYFLSKDFGLSLSGGYLYAPNGSSRNYTWGALLTYQKSSNDWKRLPGDSATEVLYGGYRLKVFAQTERNIEFGSRTQSSLQLLSMQFDDVIHDNFYLPIQAGVATSAYFGHPGSGELLVGIGAQNTYAPGDRVQAFAQMLVGVNAVGLLVKPTVGVDFALSDAFAIHGEIGTAVSRNDAGSGRRVVSSPMVGLGISYRFSLADK